MAVAPPVQLAPEKQRRLCLVAGHLDCATYGAAVAARVDPSSRRGGHARPIARTTPTVLDQRVLDLRIPALRVGRGLGQAVLAGLLGIAFLAILITRPSGDAGPAGDGGAVPSATPRMSARPTTDIAAASTSGAPTSSPAPVVAETALPSSAPSDARPTATAGNEPSSPPPASPPPATPEPTTSGATYRVRSGDTLSAIATRFGTTTKVLVALNGLSDPSKLKIGQILRLP